MGNYPDTRFWMQWKQVRDAIHRADHVVPFAKNENEVFAINLNKTQTFEVIHVNCNLIASESI